MERQGLIGDLESKSKEQLCEILSRQEKLLSNKRFVQTLPDKGKKIHEFVEKVRTALATKEDEETKQAYLASVRTEFQAKYQRAYTQRQHVDSSHVHAARSRFKENEDSMSTEPVPERDAPRRAVSENPSESTCTDDTVGSEPTCGDPAASESGGGASDTDLTAAFERVTLSEEDDVPPACSRRNPSSGSQQQKKPHYIGVLERSDENNITRPRFRPNRFPVKSASPSPGLSPGTITPPSTEARRQRDRKHLDDITAAKLPPLHHSPAQLLPLEESAALLKEQTKKHQELQAKLAAQKLAQGLAATMSSYTPEEGALGAYREVHDDGALSEED